METRANFVLIGVFTLAGFLGTLAFFIWFARVEFDRQFDYYDIRFGAVSGLSRASDVRFSGLPVGQVVDVRLSAEGDGSVVVRVEVDAETPIRTDSVARIESQGVTGVSFVGITSGTPEASLLAEVSEQDFPEIESERSVLATLTEDAPQVLEEVLVAIRQVNTVLGPDNLDRVGAILANVETASDSFAAALHDFEQVTDGVGAAAEGIGRFSENLDEITEVATTTMRAADTALLNISQLARRAESTLERGEIAMASADTTITTVNRVVDDDLRGLIADLETTNTALRSDFEALAQDGRAMIREYTATGAAATARLDEARATLAATDSMIDQVTRTLVTVDRTAADFDVLMQQEGAALVAETRVAIAGANDAIAAIGNVAESDLPAIMADIRSATDSASRAITQVSADLSRASGRVDGLADDTETTLAAATETFANANATLSAVNEALATGERTLVAAESAARGADRVINEEIGAITADLRRTMERFDAALAQVSDDVPAVTAELRAAAERANATLGEISDLIATAGAPVREFATTGLGQYTRLARETRSLVASLEQLTRQIEREPARFFLDRQSPEFRR